MATRRPSSATSLSRYARPQVVDPTDPSQLDFCNAFWGPGDAGVEVLFARLRGASRTIEELRSFWKERAVIEDDYAKRLGKLAKLSLGRDEIGELKNSLETLRLETEKQAAAHLDLASKMRQELEAPTAAFITKQTQHKKTAVAAIDRSFKNKQTQESYVQRSRERYEADCLKINSYTAQQTLMQGKELEKVRLKLERAQATVAGNERDYASFTRALAETSRKWEAEWRAFCDGAQDLEDERCEFMKDNMWAYANAVSSVCVSDDEACEHVRVALEQLEVERDMENFVASYGTGSLIPDPPRFVDYRAGASGDGGAGGKAKGREARFQRTSRKAGGAAPGMSDFENEGEARQPGERSRPTTPAVQMPAMLPAPSPGQVSLATPQRAPSTSASRAASMTATRGNPSPRPPLNPVESEDVLLQVGSNAYPVNPNADPQAHRQPPARAMSTSAASIAGAPGDPNDPMVRVIETLRQDSVRRGSPQRRPSVATPTTAGTVSSAGGGGGGGAGLIPPAPGFTASELAQSRAEHDARSQQQRAPPTNYDAISQSIVGGPPPSAGPAMTNGNSQQPHPAFMAAPQRRLSGEIPVEDVLRTYGQSLPGEREGRPLSRQNSMNPNANTNGDGRAPTPQGRPVSPARQGFPGIGAQGRSPSPQFRAPSPSPAPQHQHQHPQPPAINTNLSPAGSVGILLDAGGKVVQDSVADEYKRKREEEMRQRAFNQQQQQLAMQQQQQQAQQAHMQMQAQIQQQQQTQQQQQQQQQYYPNQPVHHPYSQTQPPAHMVSPPVQQQPPQPTQGFQQPTRQATIPPSHSYPAQQQPQQPPPQQQPQRYGPPPMGYGPPGPPQQQYAQPPPPPPQQYQPAPQQPSSNHPYAQYGPPAQPQQYGMQPQQDAYGRPVTPGETRQIAGGGDDLPPTRNWTEEGSGILFYVKALYDYQASTDEEFDFQAGDVIAVTSTPEDGWWTGELLDEARRSKGRNIFPSNFVILF